MASNDVKTTPARACLLTDMAPEPGGAAPRQDMGPAPSLPAEGTTVARPDLRVLRALRRIMRAVDLHSRKLAAGHNITAPQLVCLLAVQAHEPVTATAIARHIHISPSTVVGILDRLEAKGLVRRDRDRKDRRLVQVSVTEQGKTLIAGAPSPLQDRLAGALQDLTEGEQAGIAESLERVVELMEIRHIDAAPILAAGPIPSGSVGCEATEPAAD